MEGSLVSPVFVKVRDISHPQSEFDMCMAVAAQVGHSNVLGGQKIRGLWRIYLTELDARVKLITEQLSINNQTVHVYGDNPFRAGLDSPDDSVTKITVKDLPISYGHDEIKRYMEAKGVKIRNINYAKARNPQTKELSRFYNGDRIIFADKLKTPLPRLEEIVGQKIRIFHDGQDVTNREKLCTRCYETDHTKSQCKKPEMWCRLCKTAGHKAGENCDSTTDKPQEHVRTVYGHKDPLSNHYPCEIRVMGQIFSSAEHAYQHTKAINAKRPDIAEKIKGAEHAGTVKKIAGDIPFNPKWENRREEVMTKILQSKMDQNAPFRQELQESEDKTLVGAAAGDFYWGSGLPTQHTAYTKPERWPGKNKLGNILENLRTKLEEEENKFAKSSTSGRKGPRVYSTRSTSHGEQKGPEDRGEGR